MSVRVEWTPWARLSPDELASVRERIAAAGLDTSVYPVCLSRPAGQHTRVQASYDGRYAYGRDALAAVEALISGAQMAPAVGHGRRAPSAEDDEGPPDNDIEGQPEFNGAFR